MKIAFVIERMDTGRGGRETSTAQIAAALVRRGHQVTILCQSGSWSAPGVRVQALGARGILRARRLALFAADARQAAGAGRFDIVHAMLPLPGANVYQPRSGTVPAQRDASLRRRWLLEKLGVLLAEPLNLRRRQMARMEHAMVADRHVHCLAVSEMVAEEFARYYGRTENVRTIFNAVQVPDRQDPRWAEARQKLRFRLGVGQQDTVFLTVAKNFGLKGVSQTVAAFARWYHRRRGLGDGRLVVVGSDMVEGYQRQAGLRDVGSQVVFVPPTEDVFSWYSAADACVLLSWYDPCSRVVLEAVRWGLPAITTAFNGAGEVLGEGAGFVVASPADGRAVAEAMEALADPQRRQTARQACAKLDDRLGIDRHVEELLSVYAKVVTTR